MHLLLHSGLLPAAGAHHYLLTLTKHNAATFGECTRRPHKRDISASECISEVFVVRIMEPAFIREYVLIYPLSDFSGWDNPRIR